MPLYDTLADALLGTGVRPFATFAAPDDMRPKYFYQSSFATNHKDLARKLLGHVGPHGWVLELGSFIGMSAITWAQAAQERGWTTPVVCVDTWLGDALMWESKSKHRMLLAGPGSGGQPRIFEQFMLNVRGRNASSHVLPLRMPATIALEYLMRRVAFGQIPPPSVVFDDTARAPQP